MTQHTRFIRLVELCEQQLNEPRLGHALTTAKTLIRLHPEEPKSWHLYHLIVCLKNYRGGAVSGSRRILLRAERQLGKDLTPELRGDMLRDQALSLTTYGTRAQLARVPELVADIRRLHAHDPNRLACTVDLEARYYFACGNYLRAIELHQQAHREWQAMGEQANQVWIANNMVRLLRAMAKHYGRKHPTTYSQHQMLTMTYPDKKKQADTLTRRGGLWFFQFVLTHR